MTAHEDLKGFTYSLDFDGRRYYDAEPIHHEEVPPRPMVQGGFTTGIDEWDECPLCGEPVEFTPTHDREGYGAVPDVARCLACGLYNWQE